MGDDLGSVCEKGARDDPEMVQVVESPPTGASCARRLLVLANLGLLVSIGLSLVTFWPFEWPFAGRLQLRLASTIAVIAFLNVSFWAAGWPASALGITLLGIAMIFSAVVAPGIGLVGLTLTVLMVSLVVILMMSDLPYFQQEGWSSDGHLRVWIGLTANVILAVLILLLWLTLS